MFETRGAFSYDYDEDEIKIVFTCECGARFDVDQTRYQADCPACGRGYVIETNSIAYKMMDPPA